VVLPPALRHAACRMAHSDPLTGAHGGFERTYRRLLERYWWRGMQKEVQVFCAECGPCQTRKSYKHSVAPLGGIPPPAAPWEFCAMDLVGPLPPSADGNVYILVFTDYLTRCVEAIPIPDKSASTVAKHLVREVFTRYGCCEKLLSDRGTEFCREVAEEVFKYLAIHHVTTTPYRPQTNGLTECFNKTLVDMMSMYTEGGQSDWDTWLPYVLFAYRSGYHETVQCTPFRLLFGREARLPTDNLCEKAAQPQWASLMDYRAELEQGMQTAYRRAQTLALESQARATARQAARVNCPTYSAGDRVWLYTPPRSENLKTGRLAAKLKHPWGGPYTVVRSVSPVNYEITTSSRPHRGARRTSHTRVVHVEMLKPCLIDIPPTAAPLGYDLSLLTPFLGEKVCDMVPERVHHTLCYTCDRPGRGPSFWACTWCDVVMHGLCLSPPAGAQPTDQDWACPQCRHEAEQELMRDVSLRDPELYPVSAPPPTAAGSRIIAEQVIHNLSNRPTLQYHLQHTDLKGAVLPPE
jgi:transposase InsO family protein